MRLLLDTHIAVWAVGRPERLSPAARTLLLASDNESHVSVVSLWEIALKFATARGRPNDIGFSAREAEGHFREAGFRIIGLAVDHVLAIEALPSHHADPFDRMLLAQARAEPMHLVTHDGVLAGYGDGVIHV